MLFFIGHIYLRHSLLPYEIHSSLRISKGDCPSQSTRSGFSPPTTPTHDSTRCRLHLKSERICVVFNSHSKCLFNILASEYIDFHVYVLIGTSKDCGNVSSTATDSGCPTKIPPSPPYHAEASSQHQDLCSETNRIANRELQIMRPSERSSPNAPMSSHSFFVV